MKVELDVSELEPCEPLQRTLEALDRLSPGDYLHVIHRREPKLLFPLLQQKGMCWVCRERASGGFEVDIWRAGDVSAELQAVGGSSDS